MVAGPYALYRLLEDALTGRNVKRGTMVGAAYHYVVDPPTHLQLHSPPVATSGLHGVKV
jgi:hypothetical protein